MLAVTVTFQSTLFQLILTDRLKEAHCECTLLLVLVVAATRVSRCHILRTRVEGGIRRKHEAMIKIINYGGVGVDAFAEISIASGTTPHDGVPKPREGRYFEL